MAIKEQYFSGSNIHTKCMWFHEQLGREGLYHCLPYTPFASALLVLDMQNYFFDPASHAYIPSAPAILPGIRSLIRRYRRHRLPVLFTRHLNSPEDAGIMSYWWRDLLSVEHYHSQILPDLDAQAEQTIIKTRYDAFFKTQLATALDDLGVKQVVICGVMTHLCCESSARSAFMHDFEVIFPIDGTATYNENFHLSTLRNLAHGFASMVLISDLLRELPD
jgi:bifunctional isochorismate lyase/aryl carrier protein